MNVCNSGNDVYVEAAKTMFNIEITKSDPKRDQMKSLILGGNYGMSTQGMAKRMGIALSEAEEIVDKT